MWTLRLNGVPQRVNNMGVTIEGKVYAFSSMYMCHWGINVLDYPTEVYTFDVTSRRWVLLNHSFDADVPINIPGGSFVAYGHCAYMWNGSPAAPLTDGLYCFDTRAMRWSRPEVCGEIPEPSSNHSACVLRQRMYIFNHSDEDDESLSHICFLDLEDFRWHRVRTSGQAPTPRWWHTTSASGTHVYLWGGNQRGEWPNDHYDRSLYYLETTTATWVRPQVEGVAPQGRWFHSAFVYDKELYIFGGYNGGMDTYFADMHKYNTVKSCWSEVTPHGLGPTARRSPGCSILGERVFFFGGFRRVENSADVEHIDYSTYNEEDLSDLHVLHLAPTLQNLCLVAIVDAGLDVRGLPALFRDKIKAITSCSP